MADLKKRRLGPTELALVQMANSLEAARPNMQECFYRYTCQVAFDIGFGRHPLTKTMYMSAEDLSDALNQGFEILVADLGKRGLDGKIITSYITFYSLERKEFYKTINHITYDAENDKFIICKYLEDVLDHVHIIHDRRLNGTCKEMEARQ